MAWGNSAELTAKAKYYLVTDSEQVPWGKGEKQSGEDGEIDLKPYVYKESARCTILPSTLKENHEITQTFVDAFWIDSINSRSVTNDLCGTTSTLYNCAKQVKVCVARPSKEKVEAIMVHLYGVPIEEWANEFMYAVA